MPDTFNASPKAEAIGNRVARESFALRGNHSEIHLSEGELAAWCKVAAQLALNLSSRKEQEG